MAMRCIQTVLRILQNITPETQEAIHHELSAITSSVFFAPPEMEHLHWGRIAEAYSIMASPPKEEWQLIVCAILNDVKVDKIRAMVAAADTGNKSD